MLLLRTKLYLPFTRAHSRVVPRLRLIERLNDGPIPPFLLISAPAGSGKTTLLSDWISQSQRRVAWLSLDEGDNDPKRFWTYLIAALQTIKPTLGESAMAILKGMGEESLPLEPFLTVLLNEIAASPEEFTLVLDDYHVITTPTIHEGLTFLLDHLALDKQIIIATRSDPPLPLARLRAGDRMIEIRADDLRFTPDEAALFLNQVMGLHLAAEDIAALEARTEGWIAGLQLAALSLRGRDETATRNFVAAFTGSQRFILDYLVEQVLDRQPETTQTFLLQTSILARLSSSLCDAVTGRTDSQTLLEELERANLFLMPLDEDRRWYRYHQLFAEVLRLRLQQAEPARVPELHRRAAAWLEEQGLIDDAVRHALAAGDAKWATRMIEAHVEEVIRHGEGDTLRRWFSLIPGEALRGSARLSLARALAAFNAGHLEDAEPLLEDAERAYMTNPDKVHVPSIGREVSMLVNVPATTALLRASVAALHGDAERAIEHVQLAQTHLQEYERDANISVRWNLALAEWTRGNLIAAESAFAEIHAEGRAAREAHLTLSAASVLGQVQLARGRLSAALRTFQEGLEFAAQTGLPVVLSAAGAHVGIAEVLYERNELEAALRHLTDGIPLARQLTSTHSLATGLATLARIRQALGDHGGATEAMEEADQVLPTRAIVALHNPVPAQRAQLLLAQGNLTEPASWVQMRGLRDTDEPSYPREREYLVLTRLLMAQKKTKRALTLLEHLGKAAQAQARMGSVIEVRILEALAFDAAGERDHALSSLTAAVALAEPEQYVRVFLDEGKLLAELLRRVTGEQQSYAHQLLAMWDRAGQRATGASVLSTAPSPVPSPGPALTEPLTSREIEVLRLLVGGLSNPEIAKTLCLSVGTVRVHVKHIYGKLDVNNRTQAAARARALNLV